MSLFMQTTRMPSLTRILALGALTFVLASLTPQASGLGRTSYQQNDFARLAERIAALRCAGGDEDQAAQDTALGILDVMVLATLNAPGEPALGALNQRLSILVPAQPGGAVSFHAAKLEGRSPAYVLMANFSVAGPSAVRLYAATGGHYALAARIDRYTQKEFFDEYLELVPITGPADAASKLFVTVTGRADDLQTGAFTAWTFDGTRLRAVWSSDLIQDTSYETSADSFRLTYCAQTDEDNPRVCRRMSRDRYVWDGLNWKRVEQTPVPVPKR